MRSRTLARFVVMALLALYVPLRLVAQDNQNNRHHHYKLIDLGTFGGSQSGEVTENQAAFAPATRMMNARGIVTGAAEANVADPYNPYCLFFNCLLAHTLRWRDGVLTDLGALPGVNDSFPNKALRK
jgi:hypothetical protein